MNTTLPPNVEVGQVWRECDPRAAKVDIHVIGVNRLAGTVRIRRGNRVTTAKLKRFNGQRSGYELKETS